MWKTSLGILVSSTRNYMGITLRWDVGRCEVESWVVLASDCVQLQQLVTVNIP